MTARLSPAIALSAFLVATQAHATVDAYVRYVVPYYEPQTGDVCFMRQTMLASLGIPGASLMRATAAKVQTYSEVPSAHFANISLSGTVPAMVPAYVSDGISADGTWDYAMTLDVTALSTSNGTSITGRKATIFAAKLYLLAMAQNLSDSSRAKYRFRISFKGLPSQTGLPGTTLYATTTYPYTASSPLLASYRAELMNLSGHCPATP